MKDIRAKDAAVPRTRGVQARFMRKLSVGVKLWSTTGILSLPLIGLGIFYVCALNSTLGFTATEQEGYALYRPLDEIAQRMAQRVELQSVTLARITDNGAEVRRLDDEVAAALAQFGALDAKHGNVRTHPRFEELQAQWAALVAGKPASLQNDLLASARVFDALSSLTLQIEADWKLTLDPELSAYNLLHVAVNRMPDARRYLTETRAHLAAVYAGGEYSPAEVARSTSLVGLFRNRLQGIRGLLDSARVAAADRPGLAKQIGDISSDWDVALSTWSAEVMREMESGHPQPEVVLALLKSSALHSHALNIAQDGVLNAASEALKGRHSAQLQSAVLALSLSAIALFFGVLLMLALARRLTGAIKRLVYISERISAGHYDSGIDESGGDEISRLFAAMSNMQRIIRTQIATARAQVVANDRIRSALDNVSGCVMVADHSGEIIYTNRAVDELLRRAEADIRVQLPEFSASAVRGSQLDIFPIRPEHEQRMLGGLTGSRTAQITLGRLTLRMTVNPVLSDGGERIGTVLEWADRTAEVSVENETQSMLAAVLKGELGRRIDLSGKSGFFEVLGLGMNQLADTLLQIVSSVKLTAGEVHRAAEEISQGNADLSQRTEEQVASLQRTAASMEQMSRTVKKNAGNADLANQLATAARDQAQTGGSVVNQAVVAMADINESSTKIANIIGVIDEIAFQTNILALNAAVEAARAGEQGRGFAVVAAEVRNLAGRSAAAAREIKNLIADSVTRVEGGSVLVTRSGQTLQQIVVAVNKVTEVVAEIATASRQQSSAIDNVTSTISDMDQVTQRNASMVEQASGATKSLAEQAGTLTRMLADYRTDAATADGGSRLRGTVVPGEPVMLPVRTHASVFK
jgi:methyl-accepting chemotaxis protein